MTDFLAPGLLLRSVITTVVVCAASLSYAQEEEQAAVLLEPGAPVTPYVQLSPTEPPIVWDAEKVGEFHLLDQLGQPVTRESLLGEQWVANFIFARCATHCPMTCRKIMELNQELEGTPVRFVTITVDPEYDTVARMKEFADIWKADPNRWLFCTGEPDQVWHLIRKGFKVAAWENAGTARMPGMEFAHSNHLVHVDKNGIIVGRYDSGADWELNVLKRVLKGGIQTPERYRPFREVDKEENWLPGDHPAENDALDKLPAWAKRLPRTNASLNALATLLLMWGFLAVKVRRFTLHKRLMLAAFVVSILFLASYLTYHWSLHEYANVRGKPFPYTGPIRTVYFGILISHVILAALVPVLAIITIRNGLKAYPDGVDAARFAELAKERRTHHRWAKITFPIWLYVSVTGVVIYYMLYVM